MLIRVTVENFLSFNQPAEVLLTPGKTRNFREHIYKGQKSRDIDVLKSSIFYGANASGKSNLIKAIYFVKKMVVSGAKSHESIAYKKFKLDSNAKAKDSRIELEFKHQGENYAYGFVFNYEQIVEEWLFRITKENEYKIFERKTNDGNVHIAFGAIKTAKANLKRLEFIGQDTNANELFLHACNERNIKNIEGIEPILSPYIWFKDVLTIIFPNSRFRGMEVNIDTDSELKEVYRWFLTAFNTGIAGLTTIKVDFFSKEVVLPDSLKQNIANQLAVGERAMLSSLDNIRYSVYKKADGEIEAMKLMTKHKMKGEAAFTNFEINEESDGTQRLMDLIPALMEMSKDKKVFIIDEIERSLHPNLSYRMFELFFKESVGIPSQLICTTHEDNFLNLKLFRKDEIWFVKKTADGETQTYSLEEFKPRKDKDIRTAYLKGRFEAIPFLLKVRTTPWKKQTADGTGTEKL